MTLNRVKLGHAVTFIKYVASVVSLIFIAKNLIWNKITFPTSNLSNLAEPVKSKPLKGTYKKIYQYSYFYLIYHSLMKRFQELITNELDNFTKIIISIVFDYHELPVFRLWG